jgi:hypothetical protein
MAGRMREAATTRQISPCRSRTAVLIILAALSLAALSPVVSARESRYDREHESYVFAMTRGLNAMDIHPAFKVTILPVALVLDLAFLPFALVADATTG